MSPRKLRRPKNRAAEISPALYDYLRDGDYVAGTEGSFDVLLRSGRNQAGLRDDWDAARDDLLVEWIDAHPGTRPWGWWRFDAPRWPREDWPDRMRDYGPWADDLFAEPRRRLGGIGTPNHECLNYLPPFARGVPSSWVDPFSVCYYNGRSLDIHGAPIGTDYHEGDFDGLAPDPHDPPTFESEASYLRRHNLLTPAETKRLTPAAFEPEALQIDTAGDVDPCAETSEPGR